jgi:hypothetical protein
MADNGVGAEPIQPYTRAVDSRRRPVSCSTPAKAAKVTALEAKRAIAGATQQTPETRRSPNFEAQNRGISKGERIMTAATLEAAVERATMRAGERFVQDAIGAAAAASRVVPMTPEQRDFFIDGYIFSAVANETFLEGTPFRTSLGISKPNESFSSIEWKPFVTIYDTYCNVISRNVSLLSSRRFQKVLALNNISSF